MIRHDIAGTKHNISTSLVGSIDQSTSSGVEQEIQYCPSMHIAIVETSIAQSPSKARVSSYHQLGRRSSTAQRHNWSLQDSNWAYRQKEEGSPWIRIWPANHALC